MMYDLVFQIYRQGRWGWTVERRDDNENAEMVGFFDTKAEAESEAQRLRLIDRARTEVAVACS